MLSEINLKAIPLGSFTHFPYQKREVKIAPGDTIMLMSDGFPELFDATGEIFDYVRVQATFAEVAAQSPPQIIEHFVRVGQAWAKGEPPHDDMTFVVMKVK